MEQLASVASVAPLEAESVSVEPVTPSEEKRKTASKLRDRIKDFKFYFDDLMHIQRQLALNGGPLTLETGQRLSMDDMKRLISEYKKCLDALPNLIRRKTEKRPPTVVLLTEEAKHFLNTADFGPSYSIENDENGESVWVEGSPIRELLSVLVNDGISAQSLLVSLVHYYARVNRLSKKLGCGVVDPKTGQEKLVAGICPDNTMRKLLAGAFTRANLKSDWFPNTKVMSLVVAMTKRRDNLSPAETATLERFKVDKTTIQELEKEQGMVTVSNDYLKETSVSNTQDETGEDEEEEGVDA